MRCGSSMQTGSSISISNGTFTPAVIENGPGVSSRVAINSPSSIELSSPTSSSHTLELRRMSRDQAHGVVTLFNQEYCKLRRAHRLQHQPLVGLRFKPGGLRVTVDRPRTIRWRGVNGKVVDVVHLVHGIENQRPALRQSERARLI